MIVNGVDFTHVDALLTNFAVGYRPTGFIADEIFPLIDVPKQSDIFATFGQEDRFREWDSNRAPGDLANEVRMRVGSDNFFCKNYALSATVPDELVANADPVFRNSLEESRTSLILDALAIGWERRVAAFVQATTGVGSSATVASLWSAAVSGNSDPVGDINTAIDNVQDSTGYKPNKMVLGIAAWRALRRHPDIIDAAQNPNITGGGNYPQAPAVAKVFDLEKIHVGGAYFNGAQEGLALNLSQIWGAHATVYYNDPNPRFDTPTYAATFNWRNGPMPRLGVERFPRNEERKSQKLQAGFYQDEKIVAINLAFAMRTVA